MDSLNSPSSIKDIGFVVKNPFIRKTTEIDGLKGGFYQIFKERKHFLL